MLPNTAFKKDNKDINFQLRKNVEDVIWVSLRPFVVSLQQIFKRALSKRYFLPLYVDLELFGVRFLQTVFRFVKFIQKCPL